MNIGRRLFASLMPAAPFAAGEAVGTVAERAMNYAPVVLGRPDECVGEKLLAKIVEPAGLKPYWAAREAANAARQYRYTLRDLQRNPRQAVCMNIQSLRSVSPVMKMHMEINRMERITQEERTFTESLMDQFGLRKWFKDQEIGKENYPQAASPGRY